MPPSKLFLSSPPSSHQSMAKCWKNDTFRLCHLSLLLLTWRSQAELAPTLKAAKRLARIVQLLCNLMQLASRKQAELSNVLVYAGHETSACCARSKSLSSQADASSTSIRAKAVVLFLNYTLAHWTWCRERRGYRRVKWPA